MGCKIFDYDLPYERFTWNGSNHNLKKETKGASVCRKERHNGKSKNDKIFGVYQW
jgi:hypothetical protein